MTGTDLRPSWLERLRSKWKVKSIFQVIIILIIFSIGGSMCGYLGRKLLLQFDISNRVLWVVSYILLVTLIWPLCVLVVSIPFGQFNFFKGYIGRLLRRIFSRRKNM